MSSLVQRLSNGLHDLSLDLSQSQQNNLLDYLGMLSKWNKVYNLTSVREPDQMLNQHVLDCLAALPPLIQRFPNACELLDVGAGGGLPSVIFAIACPQWRVTAVDTVAKKAAFIQATAHSLELPNLTAVHSRVENLQGQFDVVTCRAFATLKDFCEASHHLVKPQGWWLSLKAKLSSQEISEVHKGIRIEEVLPILVPGVDVERCLVWLRQA